jgi:hypothetical protein
LNANRKHATIEENAKQLVRTCQLRVAAAARSTYGTQTSRGECKTSLGSLCICTNHDKFRLENRVFKTTMKTNRNIPAGEQIKNILHKTGFRGT